MTEEHRTGKERRMVLRLLEYWRGARGSLPWPSAACFDEREVPELWPFCFVLDIAEDAHNPRILRAGRTIASYAARSLPGARVGDLEQDILPAQPVTYLEEVMRKQVPVSRGGSFRDGRGITFLYRSIILPTSEDGHAIAALVCAANCREVVAT